MVRRKPEKAKVIAAPSLERTYKGCWIKPKKGLNGKCVHILYLFFYIF